ncbi:tyramine oxidase subunit B [Brevibacterium moorei]|uniref:tyramine oxidase subunit B n=1 Tax=Brevibacterium moorei TaxID=2968457 RepID=UPI00211C9BEE|nr:tyramine oxidase subunit B [Brevibacterium sp. 68QC2CO]MCQ9386208.1 tyramine oxidase subunit B [Brevibacterium sp. 68QC2CO]
MTAEPTTSTQAPTQIGSAPSTDPAQIQALETAPQGTRIDLLYLDEPQVIAAGMKDMATCIDVMEEVMVLVAQGDYRMAGNSANSHGAQISFPASSPFPTMPVDAPDRRFMAMAAYLGGRFDTAGVKWYGSNVDNREKGLPRSIHMIVLNDKETGAPFAIMSGNLESAYRTAAVPGAAARKLAPENAKVLGIIGPGAMNKSALHSMTVARPSLDTVKIYGRRRITSETFAEYVRENYPQFTTIEIVDSVEGAVRDCDIVSEAVTGLVGSENYPYIDGEWIKPGAFLSLPANLKMDKEYTLSGKARLLCDAKKIYEAWAEEYPAPSHETAFGMIGLYWQDLIDAGELDPERVVNVGDVFAGLAPGREFPEQPVLFSVGGMGVEDVAWGKTVYESAVKMGIGTKLNVWNTPDLA